MFTEGFGKLVFVTGTLSPLKKNKIHELKQKSQYQTHKSWTVKYPKCYYSISIVTKSSYM